MVMPFDIYAYRGEGGEDISSDEILRRRAEEQARRFKAPSYPGLSKDPAGDIEAFNASNVPYEYPVVSAGAVPTIPNMPSSVLGTDQSAIEGSLGKNFQFVDFTGTMNSAQIAAENARLQQEWIDRQRVANASAAIGPQPPLGDTSMGNLPYATAMNAEQRANQERMQMLEAQNQEIMNMLRAQGAGAGAGGERTAEGGYEGTPTGAFRPYTGMDTTQAPKDVLFDTDYTRLEEELPIFEPVVEKDSVTGLVDLNKYAQDKFANIYQQIRQGGGRYHADLINEVTQNAVEFGNYNPSAIGTNRDIFGFGGPSSFEILNNIIEIDQQRGFTPEETLFKYSGAGPNTRIGQALIDLANVGGNMSGLPQYERELINNWTAQGNQIPYELYGIPGTTMGAGTPGAALGAGGGTPGEQLLGSAVAGGPGVASGPGVAGAGGVGMPGIGGTTDTGRQRNEVYNEAYDVLEQLRQGDKSVRLPAEIYDIQFNEGKDGGPATDLIDQFNAQQVGLSPFGPDYNLQEARLGAEAEQSELQRDFDERQAELDRTKQEAELEEQRQQRFELSKQFTLGLDAELQTAITQQETIRIGQELQNSQFHSAQNFDRDQNRLDRALSERMATDLNKNNIDIANVNSEATKFVATENGLAARDVALYNRYSAKEVAEITGENQQNVANIQALWQKQVAELNNTTQKEVAAIQRESQLEVEKERTSSAEAISGFNNTSAQAIANISKTSALDVANAQKTAAENVAANNNTTAYQIAVLQGNDAFSLSQMQISDQFTNEKSILSLQKQYNQELATLTNTTEEQIATINNSAIQALENSRIAGQKNAYEAQIASAESIASAQRAMEVSEGAAERAFTGTETSAQRAFQTSEAAAQRGFETGEAAAQRGFESTEAGLQRGFATGEAAAQRAFETSESAAERGFATGEAAAQRSFEQTQADLDRSLARDVATTQYLNNLQPAEFADLQRDIARGGLSVQESENLAALVARGGLTAEQRMSEMSAESRSEEMNAFIALLANPSALGAFVTAISGELPFEAVPTMSQLSDMTPNRIQYLQGALSALGIDPQTFIRMAQDVTPQAFQETGPFGQLSAMIA